MKHVLSLSVTCIALIFAVESYAADGTAVSRGRLQLAQNTEEKKEPVASSENSDLTPLPQPRNPMATEKPVPGGFGAKRAPSAADTAAQAQQGAQTSSPSVTSPQGTAPQANAPVIFAPGGVPGTVPGAIPGTAQAGAAAADTSKAAPPVNDRSGVPPDIQEVLARQRAQQQPAQSKFLMQELSILNVPIGNLRTVKFVIDDQYRLKGMVYGEEQGYVRILSADDNGTIKEIWKSPPLNSPIRGVFVDDLNNDGKSEVIAYTADGNFVIYAYDTHDLLYRSPEGTYQNINCMVIHNMDSDPQKELFFIGVKPGSGGAGQGNPAGNLVQFDTVSRFEEWTSADLYTATDMLIGNVDTDPDEEIILNTGEILSKQFKDVKWKSSIAFGTRLYLIDMDSDGILELVTEYGESYVKIIDVDQRREKW